MGAPEKLPPSNSSMQRVKVYRLNHDGKWDDQGTGHVTLEYLERSEELGLFVIDEDDNETLLVHRISSDDIYRKQEDTIISWRDPEFSSELALSFQETTGCSYIWDQICGIQRSLHLNTSSNEAYQSANSDLRDLPAVELSTLPSIVKIVVESSVTDQCRVAELILHDQNFFHTLLDLFRICEDLENIDGLHMIYRIVRGIILFNSTQIFEKIFCDELIMDIIGCLEYDPDVPHVHHRDFLKEHVVFKEAIPIKDPLVLSKIHQTYRIGYLKDVVLPRVLDDPTILTLNTLILSNNTTVVSLLKDDSTFIQELFARLKSPTTPSDSKTNLVLFLQEFCSLIKTLQMVQQLRLFRDLVNEGIFDIIADILQSQDKKLVLIGTDILILFLNQDPNLLRSYVTRQEGIQLLGLLVKGMLTDFGDDMHCQFLEIIRSLLDSYTAGGQGDTIVEIFYEKHLSQLVDVITSACATNGASRDGSMSTNSSGTFGIQTSAKPEILLNICDLLCFCVIHHPYRIKCNFLLNGVLEKVLFLIRRREKYLGVAAVRFVRTLISRNDEHLMNHIVKNNILKPIIDAFVANGSRYNLLNSAVLELVEYIRKESSAKILLKYLIETFWDQLVKFDNLPSIQSLKLKYDQSLEQTGMQSSPNLLDSRRRIDERALEKEEEEYFNEDSDEEDSTSASVLHPNRIRAQPALFNGSAPGYPSLSPRPGGLVDYEDDEDDEDYKPPPRKHSGKSDEDEGALEFRLKRKSLPSKEEPESIKKPRIGKNAKSKESVFATLCSTLSQAVLPTMKTLSATQHILPLSADPNKCSDEANHDEKGSVSRPDKVNNNSDKSNCRSDEKPQADQETGVSRGYLDSTHTSTENRQRGGDDIPLMPPNSSPEMTVNGS